MSYTLKALTESLGKLESLRNSKGMPAVPMDEQPQSSHSINPLSNKAVRTRLRRSRGKAYLYINPDYSIDWSSPNSIVGYVSEKGNFYNFIQSHENPNFEFVEKEDWENIQIKSKVITVHDIVQCTAPRKAQPKSNRRRTSRKAGKTKRKTPKK
jgi:hypothetical protein